jgi:hypothetical protein
MLSRAPFVPSGIVGIRVVTKRGQIEWPSGRVKENLPTTSQINTCISNNLSGRIEVPSVKNLAALTQVAI